MEQRKRGRKEPSREEKGGSRKGRQEEKEKLLRVQTQAAPSNHCGWGELMQPEGIQEP